MALQDIKDLPGFKEVSPSVIQQDTPADKADVGGSITEIPGSGSTGNPVIPDQPLVQPVNSVDPETLKVSPTDTNRDTNASILTPSETSPDIPSIGVLDDLFDEAPHKDEEEDYDTEPPPKSESSIVEVVPELSGYKSVLDEPTPVNKKETPSKPEVSSRSSDSGSNPSLNRLNVSNKRGYTPDIENLRGGFRQSVEKLQEAWGQELPVVSGFRDAKRNARAGGAKKSQHIHGNAVDIDVSSLPIEKRRDLIKLARKEGFGGIGVYKNSLHIDQGSKRAWGPSYHHDSIPKWARDLL